MSQPLEYKIIDSYVKHHIPFVTTRGVVVEGHDNHMRGSMTRTSLCVYHIAGTLINSHGQNADYTSNWFYLGSPRLGIFVSIGTASGYDTRSGHAPYLAIGCSKGLRDWGLMLGSWKSIPGIVYVKYWRKSVYVETYKQK